jgi:glycosyltransferase involved in cell wall biosynthesis
LIHAQYPTITAIPALIFKYIFRIPYVYTYHGIEYVNRIERFIDLKLIYKYASKITVVSKAIQNYFYHIFKKRDPKIVFIPNGIEYPKKPIHAYGIEEYNKIVSKIDLKLIKTEFNIISYIGNMIFEQKVKGMRDFLRAFDEFLSEWKNLDKNNLRLVFLGDGPMRYQLSKAISETDHKNQILLVGERSDVSNFLAISVLSALTSYREGFPLALLESMVAGVPSIASNTGEIKEIIGNTGYIVEPGDILGMKRALHSFFSDPELQNKLGKMCFVKVKSYDWRTVGKQMAKIYQDVCSNC